MSVWERLLEQSAETWTATLKNWGVGRNLKDEPSVPSVKGSAQDVTSAGTAATRAQLQPRSQVNADMGEAQSTSQSMDVTVSDLNVAEIGCSTGVTVIRAEPPPEQVDPELELALASSEDMQLAVVPKGPVNIAKTLSKIVEHGLENDGGSNHCFLNVAIQSFWNLWSFRTRFLNAPEHVHDEVPAPLDDSTPDLAASASIKEPAGVGADASGRASGSAPDAASAASADDVVATGAAGATTAKGSTTADASGCAAGSAPDAASAASADDVVATDAAGATPAKDSATADASGCASDSAPDAASAASKDLMTTGAVGSTTANDSGDSQTDKTDTKGAGDQPKAAVAKQSSDGKAASESEEEDGKAEPIKGAESCCFCALKTVFTQYQFSEESTLPPDALRQALSRAYTSVGRFKLGEMEDALETIEALLDILHASHMYSPKEANESDSTTATADTASGEGDTASGEAPNEIPMTRRRSSEVPGADKVEEASNTACQPPCIAHEVFGIEYVDLPRCTFCDATGEPTVVSSFVYSVYVAELLAVQERGSAATSERPDTPLTQVSDQVSRITARLAGTRAELQNLLWCLAQRDVEQKCAECNSRNTVVSERWLTRAPCTFMVSLVWPSSTPSRDSLWMLLSSIQPQLQMEQIFKTEKSHRPKAPASRSQEVDHPFTDIPFAVDADQTIFVGMGDSGTQSSDYTAEEKPPKAEPPKLDSKDTYLFRGLICYYGLHYVAFFWCWHRRKWVLFDDTRVREEKDWSSVVSIIIGGQYVPTVLFYELGEGPISTEALKELNRQVRELEDRHNACSVM